MHPTFQTPWETIKYDWIMENCQNIAVNDLCFNRFPFESNWYCSICIIIVQTLHCVCVASCKWLGLSLNWADSDNDKELIFHFYFHSCASLLNWLLMNGCVGSLVILESSTIVSLYITFLVLRWSFMPIYFNILLIDLLLCCGKLIFYLNILYSI